MECTELALEPVGQYHLPSIYSLFSLVYTYGVVDMLWLGFENHQPRSWCHLHFTAFNMSLANVLSEQMSLKQSSTHSTDGHSEQSAHVWSKIVNLISLLQLFSSTAVVNLIFSTKLLFLNTRALYYELPSDISSNIGKY